MIDAKGLKTFKITNGALKGETLPRRLKFFAWGDNQSTDGNFRAGERTSSELPANQKKYGFERVAIDFNHCSVPGTDTYKDLLKVGQPPLIFGYGRVEAVANDGIYLEDIIWTPLGVQHARNFEDLSPAIQDQDGEVTLVHSVALTPNGKVEGLEFFTAAQDASEKLPAQPAGPAETAVKVAGDIAALSARIQSLEQNLKESAEGKQEAERARIVTLLSAEGKAPKHENGAAYSRDELLALDLPTLKLLHVNTPATVPLVPSARTSQIDGQGRFVSKDSHGNVSVDLAGIFESENQRNGQAAPK
jgi:hypothetical protein